MLMTALLLVATTIISLIGGLVGTVIGNLNINYTALKGYLDQFISIQESGLAGLKFLVGDIGITLVGYALGIYLAYYSVLIIYEIVTKIFLKGQ